MTKLIYKPCKYFFVFFCFSLIGCQTVRIPSGPDVSKLGLIPNAPLVGLNVLDVRNSNKIGTIGASTILAKPSETVGMTQNYAVDFLHQQGINSVITPQVDFTDSNHIQEAINKLHADGMLRLEITGMRVSSIDLLLDNPQYEVDILVIVYSKEGKSIFHEYIHGLEKSRALFSGGQGEAIGRIVSQALWTLEQNPDFRKALTALKG